MHLGKKGILILTDIFVRFIYIYYFYSILFITYSSKWLNNQALVYLSIFLLCKNEIMVLIIYYRKLSVLVWWIRVSSYFHISFFHTFSLCGWEGGSKTKLTYQKLLWKNEETSHATKPIRSITFSIYLVLVRGKLSEHLATRDDISTESVIGRFQGFYSICYNDSLIIHWNYVFLI